MIQEQHGTNMARREYLTAPLPTQKMPPGIPYIFVNEAAERFAFYGMTSILVVFMTSFLRGPGGALSDEQATEWFHWFTSAAYFLPFAGALLSDIWLAKYRTVIYFSLAYCVGLIAMAVDDTRLGLGLGLRSESGLGQSGPQPRNDDRRLNDWGRQR